MTSNVEKNYLRLKEFREKEDLTLKPSPFLRDSIIGLDGEEYPLHLRYYQVQGVLHLATMSRFVLGDDCGLGKTLQCIRALCYVWEKDPTKKVLILTTKSAIDQWVSEFEKFTTGIQAIACKGTAKKRKKIRDQFFEIEGPSAIVMGYRTAVQDFSEWQNFTNYVFVADEATAFKNPKTQVHQTCKHLSLGADRAWGLTATLIKNNLMEGFGIYKVLVPNLFGTKNNFMSRYCIVERQRLPKSNRWIPIVKGYHKDQIAEFKEKIDPYFLGRPKFAVAKELPTLTTKIVKCGMSRPQKLKYEEALSGLLVVGQGDEQQEKETTKLSAIIYCQQIANHLSLIDCLGDSEKANVLLDMLENDLAGDKIIIFTRFRKMVDLIEPLLTKAKIGFTRITGAEKEHERKANQDQFQDANSGVNVVLITMAAAEAINLQMAQHLVFYDSPWSAGDYLQILGRMIRIGSLHEKVFCYHLVCRNSIDELVMRKIRSKMKLIEQTIGKRIKGDQDEITEIREENDISQLFSLLQQEARSRKSVKSK